MSLVPLQAQSLRSQTLYLVPKRVHFIGELRALGVWRISAAQFVQRLFDGESGYFSHVIPISK
jgi:hypothetical protein